MHKDNLGWTKIQNGHLRYNEMGFLKTKAGFLSTYYHNTRFKRREDQSHAELIFDWGQARTSARSAIKTGR
jgi:hypothetical protein